MVPILRDAIHVDVACCGNHGIQSLFYSLLETLTLVSIK